MATHEENFKTYIGTPRSGFKAFVIELPTGDNRPFNAIAGNYTGESRMKFFEGAVYLEAETCSHPDAVELTIS